MIPWAEVVPRLLEHAYGAMNNDPQILLERDAYFTVDADLFHARLIGFEDEIVADWWIRRVEPILLMPIRPSLRFSRHEIAPGVYDFGNGPIMSPFTPEIMRTARYVLQSGYATLSVDGMYSPPCELRPDNTAKVAFLRYRRRA